MTPRDPVSTAFVYGLGAIVALGWLTSLLAEIFVKGYHTPLSVHAVMGTVVGSVFADFRLRKARERIERELDDVDRREER